MATITSEVMAAHMMNAKDILPAALRPGVRE